MFEADRQMHIRTCMQTHTHTHTELKHISVSKIMVFTLTTVTNSFHLILSSTQPLSRPHVFIFNPLKKYKIIRIYWFKSKITSWRNVRLDFPYVFTNQGKSSNPSQMQVLPQAVGDGGVLLHINREVKKIFIFATHLKKKKRRGIRYKIHSRHSS